MIEAFISLLRAGLHDVEPIQRREDTADLLAVVVKPARIVGLLEGLIRLAAAHVSTTRSVAYPPFDAGRCHLRALGGGEERDVAQVVDLLLPRLAGLVRRVDVFDAAALAGLDHIRDPAALHLDGRRPVGEQRRALRAVQVEHVGIPRDGRAQVGVGGLLPLRVERDAVDVPQPHGGHAAGDHVEAAGDADDVEGVVRPVRQIDPGLVEADDGVVLDVDHVYVGPVELLEVAVLETGPLDAPVVRHGERRQDVPRLRVTDARSLLLGPEIICLLVGLFVKEVVLIVAQPVAEASILPQLFVERLSFGWGVIERVLLGEGVQKASKAVFAEAEQFGVPLLGRLLLLDGEISLAHGDGQIRSPLEDLEVAGLWAPGLSQLNSRCTGSDDGALLALDRDFLVRPKR
jgi:hypothetical protein